MGKARLEEIVGTPTIDKNGETVVVYGSKKAKGVVGRKA